jgi:hypothetical protein
MTAKDEARPDTTWGMTDEAKLAWQEKYGDKTRRANAKRDKETGKEEAEK